MVFPSKSLYLLLTGLLRHKRLKNPACPNFLNTSDLQFVSLHNVMNNVFRTVDLYCKLHTHFISCSSIINSHKIKVTTAGLSNIEAGTAMPSIV